MGDEHLNEDISEVEEDIIDEGEVAGDNDEGKKNETKEEKFLRLAPPRVTKILHAMDQLGNLSSSNYTYSEEQVEKMMGAIEAKLNELKTKFAPKQEEEKNSSFTF